MKKLVCTTPNRGGLNQLEEGKEYQYVKVDHGIFQSSPYVTVKEIDGDHKFTCHFYRFSDDKEFLDTEYKKLPKWLICE